MFFHGYFLVLACVFSLAIADGSTYVRWGKRSCSYGQTVYSGVVGGSYYDHPGGAANALCLTLDTRYGSRSKPSIVTSLYGAEYRVQPHSQHFYDVLCAVCLTTRDVNIMIPGTMYCPSGWYREYYGYLMAGANGDKSASEYLCMDYAMDRDYGSQSPQIGKMFRYVEGRCGSLPCPPYVNGKIVTCVVCSK